ncbi:hypothetical protein [Streptomyces sp. 8L]|uniref:hypothetical protein n=1 Tax=Streptomyces sp. 8L TaxID=2877242 RepID=UPI001CD5A406|nr:hypothetical protein [Streptomyces sp. 8L]MCA1219102.1 hypothetical protein [Streptomyces sp. 8L]
MLIVGVRPDEEGLAAPLLTAVGVGEAVNAAAKHGVIGFPRSAAFDHAAGHIRIN